MSNDDVATAERGSEYKKAAKFKKRKNVKTKQKLELELQNNGEIKTELLRKQTSKRKVHNGKIQEKETDNIVMPVKRSKQKKRKIANETAYSESNCKIGDGDQQIAKSKFKDTIAGDKGDKKDNLQVQEPRGENPEEGIPRETIDWPQKDMSDLIKRMESAIPDKDNLAYSTRAEKLNWDDIGFKTYTGDDCKKTWLLIQKRVRRFRLLSEVLQDAKEWISKPWTNFYRGNKTKRHPDMPRRPLSVYMIFYLKKKDRILSENRGMEMTEVSKKIAQMYKSISADKREKYMQLAADERKNYEEKLDQFYLMHPEIPRYVEKPANHGKPAEIGPKKPLTPFALYYEEQLKKISSNAEALDRNTFKEQCKDQWKNMSDKKKVVWIDWALDKEAKYQDELKNYMSQNPDFAPVTLKPVLTKEEKLLKERLAGKPIKPPNSAYSLFSRMMLQSEEIKKIAPKDRMKAIADQWKNCTDKEKKQYRERASHLMEQYKLDFASYLESLPEDKRKEELQNNLPKRKLKGATTSENGEIPYKKKKKRNSSKKEKTALDKIFETEPTQPPVSGFSLFSKRYHGKAPVETAWKNLSKLEKKEYEGEVQKLKQKYIKEYETFLKSLSKEQLTAFSQLKRKREGMAMSDDEDYNNGEQTEESSNSCDSDNSNENDELSDRLVQQE